MSVRRALQNTTYGVQFGHRHTLYCGSRDFPDGLFADGGYQGEKFQAGLKKAIAAVNVEIVKRSDQAKGFVVLPKRWVVERTFAWLGGRRRLAKDWECLTASSLAFLRLASIRLMIRRLCKDS